MGTAGWVGWILAIAGIAACVVFIVLWIRKPSPEAKMLQAIDEANKARLAATAREREWTNRIDSLRREVDAVTKIPNERERLAALARLANKVRGGR